MNKPKPNQNNPSSSSSVPRPTPGTRPDGGRVYVNQLDYDHHPYPSMKDFARLLTLRYDANRTRHCYYRDLRLIHEHFGSDPAILKEEQLRDYILHVKTVKNWKPKTIRQNAASARIFFVEMLGHEDWKSSARSGPRTMTSYPNFSPDPRFMTCWNMFASATASRSSSSTAAVCDSPSA